MSSLKISIITVVYNNARHIEHCLNSVISQDYDNLEYVVIDGGSTDGTLGVIEECGEAISNWVSEPDDGIYDAMNKGVSLSSGEVVGFLNSDDFYADSNVLKEVAEVFSSPAVQCCYGDLDYVGRENVDKIIRRWRPGPFSPELFRTGWHPPHPTFFARRELYGTSGGFKLDYSVAADYELMLRFLVKEGYKSAYIPKVLVKMRTGGESNRGLLNILRANLESYRAWSENGLPISPFFILRKPLSKLGQYFR